MGVRSVHRCGKSCMPTLISLEEEQDISGNEEETTDALTRLSELGAMVSVIQEPNLDPDARMVMGLLTPVSFPHPVGQNKEGYVRQTIKR